jgi:hypothetical protein
LEILLLESAPISGISATMRATDQAITELPPQITPENAAAWFKHCIDNL